MRIGYRKLSDQLGGLRREWYTFDKLEVRRLILIERDILSHI